MTPADQAVMGFRAFQAAWAESNQIEDPEILQAIDAEFAELNEELERITTLYAAQPKEQLEQLIDVQRQWLEKLRSKDPTLPAWRQRFDDAFATVIEEVIIAGQYMDQLGRVGFQIDGERLKGHGGPLISALVEGLQEVVSNKLEGFTLSTSNPTKTSEGAAAKASGAASKPPKASSTTKGSGRSAARPSAAASEPQARPVQVNVDLAGFLGAFFGGKPKGSSETPPASPPETPPESSPETSPESSDAAVTAEAAQDSSDATSADASEAVTKPSETSAPESAS